MHEFRINTASQITNQVKIIPLGGVEEIGINCTVIEFKNKILVIDMGLGFPEGDMYGIDFIIPNIEYIEIKFRNNAETELISETDILSRIVTPQ